MNQIRGIQPRSITSYIGVRGVNEAAIKRIQAKIEANGYDQAKPIIVTPHGADTYMLIDGAYRVAACRALGIDEIPAIVDTTLTTDDQRIQRARQANDNTETLVPTTFVDDAELVWRLAERRTQQQTADVMGWSVSKVKQYGALKAIDTKAWEIVTASMNTDIVTENEAVTEKVTTVTEYLLRSILDLAPAQQLELVQDLAEGRIDKGKFKRQAEAYKGLNERTRQLLVLIGDLPDEYQQRGITEIQKGATNVEKVAETLRAEYERKTGIVLVHGDFMTEVLTIPDGSVDLIVTDPPYGVSNGDGVTKVGNKIVTADFDSEEGEQWDTASKDEFLATFAVWAEQWYRIAKPGAVIITFMSRRYLSYIDHILESVGFAVKTPIVWVKTNPNPSGLVRGIPYSAHEHMLMAVKPGAKWVFNESKVWDRRNVIVASLCGGNERVKTPKGETLHPTQKPIAVIEPLIEVFSNYGDTVFDGFMGVGTTGACAKKLGRKFIGIEQNETFFEAAKRRTE